MPGRWPDRRRRGHPPYPPWSYGPRRGPPWGRGGRHYHDKRPPRKRWGLRRRLTFAFAFVALMAVSLTTFLTLGAVFGAQRELFAATGTDFGGTHPWGDWGAGFAPARAAFAQITRTAFFAGLLSFLLASATAALLTRALIRPLLALTDGALRFGAGERGLQLRVPRSQDELRTLTEAFNTLVTGIEKQEAWRRNLVADIAHDLRTPLSILRSEIEGLQDGVISLDDAALGRLHAEVLTLSALVSGLRELSLAEGGGLPLKRQKVLLEPFLADFTESFQTRAAEVGVTLTLERVPPKLTATFDPDQLERVLGNLLGNALRYASPGAVELGAEATRLGVRLFVRDHGPGVPEDAERLFERFYQGDSSRTRNATGEKGSGLGLSIARAIVQAHGGTLTAANHPEGGAVFSLNLPSGGAQATSE